MSSYEKQLKEIIAKDLEIMTLLNVVESLELNDSWVCAGLIRNRIWDEIHHIRTCMNDIDVIYFDAQDTTLITEKMLEAQLNELMPNQPWSVKNQARMHRVNGVNPYESSYAAVAHFPETPTAIAMKIENGSLIIMAPYGLEDLFQLRVRPTPKYCKNSPLHCVYQKRMNTKQWQKTWVNLVVEE